MFPGFQRKNTTHAKLKSRFPRLAFQAQFWIGANLSSVFSVFSVRTLILSVSNLIETAQGNVYRFGGAQNVLSGY